MTCTWLRHPARTIRQPPCPTGLARYASPRHADMARLPGIARSPLSTTACTLCDGWHLKETAA